MSQHYFDPTRESEPTALPDCEVFYMDAADIAESEWTDGGGDPTAPGWYWWACFPGCLPDGEPNGPFGSEADALADAQDF